MTRSEKKELINNIRRTIVKCFLELIDINRMNCKENFEFVGCNIPQIRNEIIAINTDLDCDKTPDFKLTAYSERTLNILANLIDAKMAVIEIFNLY